ncbi:aspartate/glutamate racemase family protein [Dehalogenimonas sp. THU2]|uniref:aspartate/glutamate racemase family protein n=1 Tax=Dehalogenimonas sp. THU2 TaxID=3151121 RepID=UPI003218A690
MKTIGLLGGMSWNSTADYYRLINEGVARRLGGLHSAKIILHSFDFDEIEQLQSGGLWAEAAVKLSEAAGSLKSAGAEFLVIATNTMHKVADEVESASGLPMLHIAESAGESVKKMGLKKVGLLGTRFTMSEGFYSSRLTEKFGIEVLVPDANEQQIINSIIYDELCRGCIQDASRWACQLIIENLVSRGAEGIVLACTELPLLIKQSDVMVPVFDTSRLHVTAAVARALA